MLISSATDLNIAMKRISVETANRLHSAAIKSKACPNAVDMKISVVITKILNAKETTVHFQGEPHTVFAGGRHSISSSLTMPISTLFSMTVLVNTDKANSLLGSHIESELRKEQPFHLEKVELSIELLDKSGVALMFLEENCNPKASVSNAYIDFNKPTKLPPGSCVIL